MDLFEYQARDMFEKHGMAVLPGKVAHTPEEAYHAAVELGADQDGKIVVVKAQVKTGGRGKAGGVKLAKTPDEAKKYAEDIIGMDINGHTVHRVMVAAGAAIDEEYYFSILLDRTNRSVLCMCSKEGGMDIETLAVERPEALAKVQVDPLVGIDQTKAEEIYEAARFTDNRAELISVFQKLWEIYRDEDATLVEVNPLVRTTDGEIIALDGKVTIDGNAEFRHPEHASLVDEKSEDPLEALAKDLHLNYVKLDGAVGIIGNGAGLVMSTLDVVAYAGEDLPGKPHPANFLDIGGGASAKIMADGLSVILGDNQVRSVFVNVFGGITACDEVANGIVQALDMLGEKATKPLVVRLDGNAVTEGRRILAERNHPLVTVEATMDGAARKAAELAVVK